MHDDLVAIFDVGKTNAKVILAHPSTGEVAWSRTQPNRSREGPYRHFDVDALETFLLESLATLPDRTRVQAIVPVTHGACAALVDDRGLALPILDYEDPRVEEISADYETERDAFDRTLSPSLPLGLNLGRQLLWLKRRFPDAFGRAKYLLPYPQYWSWRLSGIAACERTSLGAHTDLWLPRLDGPSAFAERHGFAALLPPLKAAADPLGPLLPAIAAKTGLPASPAVLCGIHDSNASYIRHRLARQPGEAFAVVSTGTWSIVMANGADLARLDARRDMLANINALGEPVATARFMGGREYDEILGGKAPVSPTPADVAAVIESKTLALPCFAGTGGPFQRAKGRIHGDGAATPGRRAALASLYLALTTDYVLDLLGAEGDVVVEGPQAENALFLAALATFRPGSSILRSSDSTGTVGGTLALINGAPLFAPCRRCEPHPLASAFLFYRDTWRGAVEAHAGPA